MIAALLTTLLPALVPAAVDGVRGLANKLLGGEQMKPANFADYIKMEEMGIAKLKALAELDKPTGNISVWVANLRASCRYIMGYLIIAAWLILKLLEGYGYIAEGSSQEAGDLARVVFGFLFGDRMWRHLKSPK